MDIEAFTSEQLKRNNPEKYYQEVLEVSEFEALKKLEADSLMLINFKELAKDGVLSIVNGKVEGIYWQKDLYLNGTQVESLRKIKRIDSNLYCSGLTTLKDLGELTEVNGDCILEKTNIKSLGNLKKVNGLLSCFDTPKLEYLGALIEVGDDFILEKTNVKTIGNRLIVGRNLYCYNNKTLETIESGVRVHGNLVLIGVGIEVQLKILSQLLDLLIVVGENSIFGGDIEGIEKFFKLEEIPGELHLKKMDLDLQIMAITEEQNGNLYIDNVVVDDIIENTYYISHSNGELDFQKFQKVFGIDIDELDGDLKLVAIAYLKNNYKEMKEEIKYKGELLIGRTKRKSQKAPLTEDEKKLIREKLQLLDLELKEKKAEIERFGVKL